MVLISLQLTGAVPEGKGQLQGASEVCMGGGGGCSSAVAPSTAVPGATQSTV